MRAIRAGAGYSAADRRGADQMNAGPDMIKICKYINGMNAGTSERGRGDNLHI